MYYQPYYQSYTLPTRRKWYNPNRFTARAAGVAFFLSALILTALQFAVAFLPPVKTPYVLDILFTFLSQGAMLLLALIIAKVCGVSLIKGGGDYAEKPYSRQVGALFLMVAGCMWVFGPLADFLPTLMFTEEQIAAALGETPESPLLFIYFACVVTLPAVCEELLFRGVICRGLTEWGKVPAIFLSAAAFMLMHANPMQTIHQFAGGVLFGIIMVETGNIYLCMIFHAFNNGLGGLLSFSSLIENTSVRVVITVVLACLGVVFLIFGIRLILRKVSPAEGDGIPLAPFLAYSESQKKYLRECKHYDEGNYFYAVKEEVDAEEYCKLQAQAEEEGRPPLPPMEIAPNGKAYVSRTGKYFQKEEYRLKQKEKWFYTDETGWKPMCARSAKAKGIVWLCLGAAINIAMWLFLFFSIRAL